MCGRFTLRTPTPVLIERFQLETMPELAPRYNISPTQDVLAIRLGLDGNHQAVFLRWGLIPSWSKDLAIASRLINARADTVAEKPSFRAAFKKRRCLILADAYIEWKGTEGKKKQPYLIELEGQVPFAMAGIWEIWQPPKDTADVPSRIETCSILTTDANASVQAIHDRMPVILPPAMEDLWLDPEVEPQGCLAAILAAENDISMSHRKISTRINNPRNEGPACFEESSV
jgi:putative SOS response-associated peptidase YedK